MIRSATNHDNLRSTLPDSLPIPAWLRSAANGQTYEDAGFAAGAALGALDAVVRAQNRSQGAWRQRLALTAAAATCRALGRAEDEAALRDAACLTRPGDDAGPGGRVHVAWRMMADQSARQLVTERTLSVMLTAFGVHADVSAVAAIAMQAISSNASAVAAAARVGESLVRHHPDMDRGVAPFLADAVLARKLDWQQAVPLSAAHRFTIWGDGAASDDQEREGTVALAAHHARAALGAIDLAVMLERRAQNLLSVAPSLRAKGSDAVVQLLLADDAVAASRGHKIPGISDRGLRRLFDRLVRLGGVRELTGRTAFRLYGL